MEIQLYQTSEITIVNGVQMRVWEGVTAGGVPVVALIARLAVPENLPKESFEQFEAELKAMPKPSVIGSYFGNKILEL